jgi:hypothetical protein
VEELLKSLSNLSSQDLDDSDEVDLDQSQNLEHEIQAFLKDHPVNNTGGGSTSDSNAKVWLCACCPFCGLKHYLLRHGTLLVCSHGPQHLHCLLEPSQESSSSEDDYQAVARPDILSLGAPSLAELQHLGRGQSFSEMEKRVRGALEVELVSTHTPLGQKDHLRQGATPASGFGSASTIDASKGERAAGWLGLGCFEDGLPPLLLRHGLELGSMLCASRARISVF